MYMYACVCMYVFMYVLGLKHSIKMLHTLIHKFSQMIVVCMNRNVYLYACDDAETFHEDVAHIDA